MTCADIHEIHVAANNVPSGMTWMKSMSSTKSMSVPVCLCVWRRGDVSSQWMEGCLCIGKCRKKLSLPTFVFYLHAKTHTDTRTQTHIKTDTYRHTHMNLCVCEFVCV